MQTQVIFYVLNDEGKDTEALSKSSAFHQACLQAAYFYRKNQRVFIFTNNQQDAEKIDECLWAFDAESFVPHNLVGEGPKQGAMVEISWQPPQGRRPVLINLSTFVPTFANQFSQVIDFVPSNETLKQQARDRFRTCKQWGFQLNSQAVAEI